MSYCESKRAIVMNRLSQNLNQIYQLSSSKVFIDVKRLTKWFTQINETIQCLDTKGNKEFF